MKTRNEIITSMCYTHRHDYNRLQDNERQKLWNQMAKIFDNDIMPNMEIKTTREHNGRIGDRDLGEWQ
jgi:hypothetical protein